MRAAVIENGLVSTIVDVPSLDAFGESVKLVEVPEWVVSDATWDGEVFTNPTPPPPTPEQIVAQYTAAVQKHLDDFARTRGYDGILSAATYATSTVPKFKAEGQYAVEARDATWAKCYEVLAAVEAGSRPMSTLDELLAELPVLEWPN